MKMGRKEARDIAFKIVYQMEYQDVDIEEAINNISEEDEITDKAVIEYINVVSNGVKENTQLIEDLIKKNLKENWDLSRISKVNRAVLEVAIYEMMFMKETVPGKVAINEALNLVDSYGEPGDKSFINGILANILKECEND